MILSTLRFPSFLDKEDYSQVKALAIDNAIEQPSLRNITQQLVYFPRYFGERARFEINKFVLPCSGLRTVALLFDADRPSDVEANLARLKEFDAAREEQRNPGVTVIPRDRPTNGKIDRLLTVNDNKPSLQARIYIHGFGIKRTR